MTLRDILAHARARLRAANSSALFTALYEQPPKCGVPDAPHLAVPEGTDLRRILLALETSEDEINVYEIAARMRCGEARVPYMENDLRSLREAGYVARRHVPGTDLFAITAAGRAALEA